MFTNIKRMSEPKRIRVMGYIFDSMTHEKAKIWNFFFQMDSQEFFKVKTETGKEYYMFLGGDLKDLEHMMKNICDVIDEPYKPLSVFENARVTYVQFCDFDRVDNHLPYT